MDPQVALAREEHELSLACARQGTEHRRRRDEIIRRLREQDKLTWSYGKLARDIGISRELVIFILKKKGRQDGGE